VRRLVVTGDDFGASREVNQATIEAHERGVLTTASLMVTGDAYVEAVSLARKHPRLAVGLHLVLVDGRSALPPRAIPRLVDSRWRFRSSPTRAGLVYQFDRVARSQLRSEIRQQLERFRLTNLVLSHVDGHHDLHLHPVVLDVIASLADDYGIRIVRLPSEEVGVAAQFAKGRLTKLLVLSIVFGLLRHRGARRLRAAGVAVTDRVYGLQCGSTAACRASS
jgi:hopanoid biosynthesis associated protein HpnK